MRVRYRNAHTDMLAEDASMLPRLVDGPKSCARAPSNDAVNLLGAIAVGFAAGSNELDVGVAISMLLSITLVLLWKVRLDAVKRALLPKDHESRHGHHNHDPELTEPSVERSTSPEANGNGTAPSLVSEQKPQALARLGYIVLETEHAERTRLLVETFLKRETKSWRLGAASPNRTGNRDRRKHAGGVATLMYLVRFRKGSQPEAIVERLKALGQSSHFSVRLETGNDVVEQFV
jgi:hypothetical protein